MSDVVKAVAGVALFVASFYTGGAAWLVQVVRQVGVALVINGVADALTPKPRLPGNPGIQQEYSGTVQPRIIIYGQVKVSGMNAIEPLTSGNNNQHLHQILVLANKPCNAITDVYFDQTLITSATIGPVAGADTDGVVSGTGPYNGKAWIRRYTGNQSTVDYILNSTFPTLWDANHKGQGNAYLAIRYLYDVDAYRNGKPQVTAIVQGAKCYDPRLDISPGANPTNPSYIVYTTNPALCLADYLIDPNLGLADVSTNLNWNLVVAAANTCDEAVAVPGGTQARFTCNVVIDCTARYEDNIAVLAGAMMGQCIFSGGQWLMYAGHWTAPEFSLSESDLTGPVAMSAEIQRTDKYNFVRGSFIDPTMNYQEVEFQPRGNAAYEATDGERIQKQVQFPACTNQYEAQRNAIILLNQSRNRRFATKMCGMSAYKVRPWNTGTDTLAALGWSAQTVRCVSWKFTPNGQVQVGLREESAANWADPLVTDYAQPGTSSVFGPGLYVPGLVANLTSFAQTDGFILRWDNPSNYIGGVVFDVYEYGLSSPASSATLIRSTAQSSIMIEKSDTATHYYWIRARIGNTSGGFFPTGYGVAAGANAISGGYRASASPSSGYFNSTQSSGGPLTLTTNVVTISPSGGTAPYTYSWALVSGDTVTTISSTTASAVSWTRGGVAVNTEYDSIWRCTVTDAAARTTTVDVSVSISRYTV